MKIWIDIGHAAQLNFYRNAINALSIDNNIILTVLDRGKLVKIARKELGLIENCTIIKIGSHSGSKISAIIDANILKLIKLYHFYLKYKPQIALGNGYLHGVIGKSFNFPVIMFSDDIERKVSAFLMNKLSSELYYVTGSDIDKIDKKISIFNSLKEWAYLSPKYFQPNEKDLIKYSVKANNYIFVREVITGTLNYQFQDKNMIASISDKFPKGLKVLLSLEDKNEIRHYPKDWILLKEPVEDIHSLIYYSKVLISSGDSMAREGSILGVPSVYCGIRDMKANNVMIKKGMLFHEKVENTIDTINRILNILEFQEKEKFRNKLNEDWIDITQFIVNRVNNYKN